jgi:hypothetical protein
LIATETQLILHIDVDVILHIDVDVATNKNSEEEQLHYVAMSTMAMIRLQTFAARRTADEYCFPEDWCEAWRCGGNSQCADPNPNI